MKKLYIMIIAVLGMSLISCEKDSEEITLVTKQDTSVIINPIVECDTNYTTTWELVIVNTTKSNRLIDYIDNSMFRVESDYETIGVTMQGGDSIFVDFSCYINDDVKPNDEIDLKYNLYIDNSPQPEQTFKVKYNSLNVLELK